MQSFFVCEMFYFDFGFVINATISPQTIATVMPTDADDSGPVIIPKAPS